jgi:hypothetical protein
MNMPSYDPYEDAVMAVLENRDHQKIVEEPKSVRLDHGDRNDWAGSVRESRTWDPACFPSLTNGMAAVD